MLIELIVTCVLAEGQKFTPPSGWDVRSIQAYSSSANCTRDGGGLTICYNMTMPDHPVPTTVMLAREAKIGEKIVNPEGCKQMEATTKE